MFGGVNRENPISSFAFCVSRLDVTFLRFPYARN
jgi:hypothetical protein